MSDLSMIEKRKLEKVLQMEGGYVLGFSNRTFQDFFSENFNINIYDEKYAINGSSKANHLRTFWTVEGNYLVGKILDFLFQEWNEFRTENSVSLIPDEIRVIVERLKKSPPIETLNIATDPEDITFEILAKSVRESIDKNEPEVGLDRLHTYVVKYFKKICLSKGILVSDKPLHSLVAEYIKYVRGKSQIESEMSERILKSSISILESFNFVRNNQSLAHDNHILNREESILIFSYVSLTINFIERLERENAKTTEVPEETEDWEYDIPF